MKLKAKDIFEATVMTYCDPEGAEAYVVKEMPVHDVRTANSFRLVDDLNVTGWRVLDVGCGFGRDVGEFRRRGAEAFGVDVSEALLSRAREQYGPYFRVDNVRSEGPFAWAGPFDLIWCCAVLVHVPRAEKDMVLKRMWNVLKPGGRLAIWTKVGEGEKVYENLGRKFPRVMMYYSLPEVQAPLEAWGGVLEVSNAKGGSVFTGVDDLLCVRVRKPTE
jgi:SAM-dependent methyltransferase